MKIDCLVEVEAYWLRAGELYPYDDISGLLFLDDLEELIDQEDDSRQVTLKTDSIGLEFEIVSDGPDFYSCGTEYEVSQISWRDVVDGDLKPLIAHAVKSFELLKPSTDNGPYSVVRFLTAWTHHSYYDTISGEYDSNSELLGVVDLQSVPWKPLEKPNKPLQQ